MLLSFLKIRVIVNNHDIYPLLDTEAVVIPVEKDNPRIVVTDGFHFTKPLKLTFKKPGYFNFDIVCAIDDWQLWSAGISLVVLYLLGFATQFFLIKLFSFSPIIWFLCYYYLNMEDFLRIKQNRG